MNGSDRTPDRTLGQVVNDVSEKAALLVREEIELAKAEVTEKVTQLARGAVVVAVAGVVAIFGISIGTQTLSWVLAEVFDSVWLGFLVTTGILFLLAAVAGLIAMRSFKKGAPPVPGMAIDEAKRTREELEGSFSQ